MARDGEECGRGFLGFPRGVEGPMTLRGASSGTESMRACSCTRALAVLGRTVAGGCARCSCRSWIITGRALSGRARPGELSWGRVRGALVGRAAADAPLGVPPSVRFLWEGGRADAGRWERSAGPRPGTRADTGRLARWEEGISGMWEGCATRRMPSPRPCGRGIAIEGGQGAGLPASEECRALLRMRAGGLERVCTMV